MADSKLVKLKYKTYLKMIENSVGSRIFNSAFVRNAESGKEFDVLNDGEFSCAFFVSGLLTLVGVMDKPHATVKTLLEKIQDTDSWDEADIDDLKPGDIIFWEEAIFEDGSKNGHVGFYLDEANAVSTDWEKKTVSKHHLTFGENKNGKPKRKIERAFRNEALA